jgi:ATP-binding cassette, subfamily F, member 3
MIQLQGVSQAYPDKTLYENLDFQFYPNEKAALIGKNGTGKSTLLKMIAGEESPNKGKILIPKTVTIAYLPQEIKETLDSTVIDHCLSAFEHLQVKEKTIQQLSSKLVENSNDSSQILNQIAKLQEELDFNDYYKIEFNAKKILSGLGFTDSDFTKNISSLSGGWRMRVLLATILLKNPDFILLDEPSNHLDYESLDWLENFLKNYQKGVIIISHDKRLLDNIIDVTIELENRKLSRYLGNFSYYLAEKEQNELLAIKDRELKEREIARIEKFVDRFRFKASKAKQVQSRVKALEKINIEHSEAKSKDISFKFAVRQKSGKHVIQMHRIKKTYDKILFEGLTIDVIRGDKIALLGANGAGKSTLIKLILSQIQTDSGSIEIGHNVQIGHFSQHQYEALDLNNTIIDEVSFAASEDNRTKVRTILGHFLFSNEDVFKKISILSGGEKARVALAKLLVSPINTIIMDEPTNHLDLSSKEMLQDALMEFDGTLIIVSHDRDFLDGLTNKVWLLKNQSIYEFIGEFTDFEQQYHEEMAAEKQEETKEKSEKKNDYEDQKKQKNIKRKLEKEISQIEEKQTLFEEKMETIKNSMFDEKDHLRLTEMQDKIDQLNKESEELLAEWEAKQIELENIS